MTDPLPPALVSPDPWFFVRSVLKTFEASEADGYHTKDREFAIGMLRKALEQVPPALVSEAPREDKQGFVATDRHIEQAGGDLLDDLTESAFIFETLTDEEVDRLHRMIEWRIRQAITHRMRYGIEDTKVDALDRYQHVTLSRAVTIPASRTPTTPTAEEK